MKFFLLINVKMPTAVGILTFMSRKNGILSLSKPEKSWISWYFHTYEHLKFHAQLSWAWKKFYNLGACVLHCLSGLFSCISKQPCAYLVKKRINGGDRSLTEKYSEDIERCHSQEWCRSWVVRDAWLWCRKSPEGCEIPSRFRHEKLSVSINSKWISVESAIKLSSPSSIHSSGSYL